MRLYGKDSYFTTQEFACACGCGFGSKQSDIDPVLIEKLNILRVKLGRPMIVSSGARCQEHNKAIGGSLSSAHLPHHTSHQCRAVDIKIRYSQERYDILEQIFKQDWQRVGIAKTFIHLDVAWDNPTAVAWLY